MRWVRRIAAVLLVTLGASLAGLAGAPIAAGAAAPDAAVGPGPRSMAPDRLGNMWLLLSNGDLQRISPASALTTFADPRPDPAPVLSPARVITAGADTRMWYLRGPTLLTRVNQNGKRFDFPVPGGRVVGELATGDDGNVWFTAGTEIGRVTADGVFTFFSTGLVGAVSSITSTFGGLWIKGTNSPVARVGLDGAITAAFTGPPGGPVAVGLDGYVWYPSGSTVVRVHPVDGAITVFPTHIPGADVVGRSIVGGTDAAMWVADAADHLVRVGPAGQLLPYYIRLPGQPPAQLGPLATAGDGDLWFGDHASGQTGHVENGDNSRFVDRVHRDLLGRPADLSARYFWTTKFLDGSVRDRGQLATFLTTTREFREHLVDQLFTRFLRRAVDDAGRSFWAKQLAEGATPESLRAMLIGSDEYFVTQSHSDIPEYVNDTYQDLLARAPDEAGFDYWVSVLEDGSTPRSQVGASIVYSEEAFRVLVQELYGMLLGRPADAGGETYWAGALRRGELTDATLIAALTASDEYFARFP